MYSVLIMNGETLKEFSHCRPFFAEALNSSKIGLCRWNEAGTTISSALPELSSLTDDKKEWRAIIVRVIDETAMAACRSKPYNPYDFEENAGYEGDVRENPVPLVRLTQMLGGVPPVEVEFEAKIINESHRAAKTIYVPYTDPEKIAARRELMARYSHDSVAPASIILISVRKGFASEEPGEDHIWHAHSESESSFFWKRNQYPSFCRFLVYDSRNEGPVRRDADKLNFWLSVFLFATNDIDPATLQAYRLYTVNTVIDSEPMTDYFQILSERLKNTREAVQREIQQDIREQISNRTDLPDYRIDVPVNLNLDSAQEIKIGHDAFPKLSDGITSDIGSWDGKTGDAETALASMIRSASRSLDQAAEAMWENITISADEVEPLSRYQEEDLTSAVNNYQRGIIRLQAMLPSNRVSADGAISSASDSVRGELRQRVLKAPARALLILMLVLLLLFSVPSIVFAVKENPDQTASPYEVGQSLSQELPAFTRQYGADYNLTGEEWSKYTDPAYVKALADKWDDYEAQQIYSFLDYYISGKLSGAREAQGIRDELRSIDPRTAEEVARRRETAVLAEKLGITLAAAAAIAVLSALFAWAVLSYQKQNLNGLIDAYNQRIGSVYNRVVKNADEYSSYMSAIASHVRGVSYLGHSAEKKRLLAKAHESKSQHLRTIGSLLTMIEKLSRAYHLDVDVKTVHPYSRVSIDTSVAPRDNKAYYFGSDARYPLSVNTSGETIESPYPFISGLEIVREELYDDE